MTTMTTIDGLTARVRGEYREMPGLRLTLPQACRFWQIDSAVCERIFTALVAERFLDRRPDGGYVALPGARLTPAPKVLRPVPVRLTQTAA